MNEYMICSPYFAAMLDVYVKFAGRDWRRIKRECRKAERALRRKPDGPPPHR